MMKAGISPGVHRDWQSFNSGRDNMVLALAFTTPVNIVLTAAFGYLSSYGDMPAHSFLWRECEKSSDNVAARLAVIPLVQVLVTIRVPRLI